MSGKIKRNEEGGFFWEKELKGLNLGVQKVDTEFWYFPPPGGEGECGKCVKKHCTKYSVVLESGFRCGMLGIVSRSK